MGGGAPKHWVDALRELDPDLPVAPGVRVADLLAVHDRLEPPPGARLVQEVYSRPDGVELWIQVYARASAERRPAVLFIHGGGWQGGDLGFHLRRCAALAELGYVAASIDYRLAPAHRWPAQRDDCEAALGWLVERADELGIDPARIAVAGDSAGGHLALWLALRPGPARPAAAVTWYPAVDLAAVAQSGEAGRDIVLALVGTDAEERLRAASPLWLVDAGCPPVLTMTGTADLVTAVGPIERFHARLDELGVRNRLRVFPEQGHAFDHQPDYWHQTYAQLIEFVGEILEP